jgi:hypothetical protein
MVLAYFSSRSVEFLVAKSWLACIIVFMNEIRTTLSHFEGLLGLTLLLRRQAQ